MNLLNYINFINQKISKEISRKLLKKILLIPTNTSTKLLSILYFHRKFPSNPAHQNPVNQFSLSQSWAYSNLNWNKLMHILTGNRRVGYNIAVWNCRKGLLLSDNSPSEKLLDIKSLLQRHDLHLLGIVESDLHGVESRVIRANPISTKEILKNLHIEGYSIKLPKTWKSHGQARIILYVREGVTIKMREVSNPNSDLPSVSCEIGLGREKRTCANFFYREWTGGISGLADSQSQVDRLSRQIMHWRSLYTGGRDVVILGDSNLCSFRWAEETYQYKNLSGMIQEFLLETSSYQQVKQYTRCEVSRSGVSRSCIDHCYSDVPEKLSMPIVESAGDSDHLAVIVTKYTKAPVTKPQTVRKRNYKHFSVSHFLTDILNSNINESVTAKIDLEEAAREFEDKFEDILSLHAPMKTYQMRKNYSPHISQEKKLLIAERKSLQEESVKSGNAILLKEFKQKAKEVKKATKTDKKEYNEKNMGEDVDVNKAWKTARGVLGIEKNLSPSIIFQEGEKVSNPLKMANVFNEFFVHKIKVLREKTATEPVIDPIERLKNWTEKKGNMPKFSLNKIDVKTFRKILKRMKGKRSHGIDNIDSFSLKLAGPLIEDALMHLINLSIESQRFSSQWKPQLIFPLHKKCSKLDAKNYRPVSHLVEVGKMVEYAVYEQVIGHFTDNNLFHENHHGSLSGHSTATALIQLVDMWLEASEDTLLSAALLLDQSAAYDLVDHLLLLQKLKLYNFSEESIAWFSSYLGDRSQVVQVESKQSQSCNLGDHGVPQGSILGGLIFIIFSNDFPACNKIGESVMYVDDDTDVVHDNEPVLLHEKIQHVANESSTWLTDNRMCVAGEKSKLLVIGTKKLRSLKLTNPMEIIVSNMPVKETKSEKLLGIIINNELTWKEHLHGESWREEEDNAMGLIPQLSQRVGILRKLSKYVSGKRLKLFAEGIFYSKLNYCLPVFGHVFGLDKYRDTKTRYMSYTKEDNNKLQVLQNSIMRLLTGKTRSTPTTELLRCTNSLSVQQLVASHTLNMVHKIVSNSKPAYLAKRLKVRNQGDEVMLSSRNQGKVSIPRQKLSNTRGGFVARGAQLFNNLPLELRLEKNLKKFKVGARKWITENIQAKPS